MTSSLVYGPVPSRRLGRSLGINNIPPKKCSYSCVYCQLGLTADIQIRRRVCYQPQEIVRNVRERIGLLREKSESIDYLAFVPDGEPTLDINLGIIIKLLREFEIKIAVITNASLIWHEDVQQDLLKADWISLKVDAFTPDIWREINRPHRDLNLDDILKGMLGFAKLFKGELTTETMLIRGINDSEDEAKKIAAFLAELKPTKAYLAVPTRPPAEQVEPAIEQSLNNAYQTFSRRLNSVEYLIGYEGNAFASTGNIANDLLSITAVHPMREEAVGIMLDKLNVDWGVVRDLIDNGSLVETEYQGKKFYARKIAVKTV